MSDAVAGAAGSFHGLPRAYLRRRYAILFYSLLLTLGAAPLLSALGFDADLLLLFLALNLLAAVVGGHGGVWRAVERLVAAVIVVRFVAAFIEAPSLATATLPLWTAIALLGAARAVGFAMRAVAVDAEHIYAALSAYLLAGLFCGVLYRAIEQTWPGSFATAGESVASGLPLSSAFYFSFVTLATLGYGDIVPRTEVARGIAIVEAVAGQLYLVVMVARLVSLYVREPRG
jgi:Ion channel